VLKPIEVEYRGRKISLECTHKKEFPPPQMYGNTPDDIDTMWRQGSIDQNLYQHLVTWRDKCGIMVMGPKCLDCPLALKRNPRPGRPSVVETEPWLAAKNRIHWEDMEKNKTPVEEDVRHDAGRPPQPVGVEAERAVLGDVERPHVPEPGAGARQSSDDVADQISSAGDESETANQGEHDDIIDALADD